jgi:hypothetical protein
MRELLAAELVGRGFVRDGARATRDEGGGVTTEVDLDTGEVDITAEGHSELDLKATRVGVVAQETAHTEEGKLKAQLREGLEREAEVEEDALKRDVARQLEGRLKDLKPELDGVVNRVTATALKQRAAELGTVEEVREDESGGLTIKVRL